MSLKEVAVKIKSLTRGLLQFCQVTSFYWKRLKQIDHSKVPVLVEKELEEQFVKGSGPGGQSVNKTVNCVVLIHKPTGILVKCHHSRLLSKNREIAREWLIAKLDAHFNGDQSVEAQKQTILDKKNLEQKRRRNKLLKLKQQWLEREKETD